MAKHYRELIAWQKAMSMVTHIYETTKTFPHDEKYGLVSQIRRSAVSVPSNIAEGQARNSSGEFIQFLGIARGSTAELTTQLLIAANLGYINKTDKALPIVEEVGRLLSGLIKSLKTNN
ncbi:four helix bundle protein [Gimesia aquarii]|uniref:Four helix bundle protein n=1 Tax=Gimesia aquarii TaxID=2527964 RepID=A0A517WV17_9PLAN|nr:four helix bundle protein [Gimesia aquarii]QDU09072.1 hypothetical protein V202x_24430 [Gimesia aquarii]